jgi:hypothetical protein
VQPATDDSGSAPAAGVERSIVVDDIWVGPTRLGVAKKLQVFR